MSTQPEAWFVDASKEDESLDREWTSTGTDASRCTTPSTILPQPWPPLARYLSRVLVDVESSPHLLVHTRKKYSLCLLVKLALLDQSNKCCDARTAQGDAFLAREKKQGAAETEAPAKKEVRGIEFFPAASSHHNGGRGRVSVPDEFAAASHTAPQLDLSLRLDRSLCLLRNARFKLVLLLYIGCHVLSRSMGFILEF
jgi:hypothetical protein